MTNKPTAAQKHLIESLQRITKQLGEGYTPPSYRRCEQDGLMLLRAGVAMYLHGEKAEQRATDWIARGMPSGGGEPVSGGGMSDPTPLAADSTDEWEKQLQALRDDRFQLAARSVYYESNVAKTIRTLENDGRRSSLIECANPKCDNTMTGIGSDRPRRGRCDRCRKHLDRYDIDWPARAEEDAA